MSLIDEALKRAQAATPGAEGREGDRPWVPTPMPDAGRARGLFLRRATWAALLTIAAGGAAYWYAGRRPAGAVARPRPASHHIASEAAVPAPSLPTSFPLSVVAPPPRGNARVIPADAPAPAPAPVRAVEAAPAARAPRLASGRTYAGSVALSDEAKIELGGIVWSEAEPRALLNDRVLGVGGYVEGFVVTGIETDRVALRKDDLVIYLSVK